MRNLILICLFTLFSSSVWTQTIVPDVTQINHSWVDGVYVNLEQLPNWGVFVDAQEESFFGAFYGYEGSDATFLILQGTMSSVSPLIYSGDAFFITNGGNTATDVGDFTWNVRVFESSPAASLTLSSNILNVADLLLTRFSYVEEDKIDIFTAADWNITTRTSTDSFAYHFGVTDDRIESDGFTGALVVNNEDPDLENPGVAIYVPPGSGDAYGILVPFLDDTDLFALFFASDTEWFGRYWLLGPSDLPEGNGSYFHGATNTLQASNQEVFPPDNPTVAGPASVTDVGSPEHKKRLHRSVYEPGEMEARPMFPAVTVNYLHEALRILMSSGKGKNRD